MESQTDESVNVNTYAPMHILLLSFTDAEGLKSSFRLLLKLNLLESFKMACAPSDLAATLQNYLAQGRSEPRCAVARRNAFHGRFLISRTTQQISLYQKPG